MLAALAGRIYDQAPQRNAFPLDRETSRFAARRSDDGEAVLGPHRDRVPTILRAQGYRFFFFSNEGDEPPHIHVERAECTAKFWLSPTSLANTVGFRSAELAELHRLVRQHRVLFEERWHEYFGV